MYFRVELVRVLGVGGEFCLSLVKFEFGERGRIFILVDWLDILFMWFCVGICGVFFIY